MFITKIQIPNFKVLRNIEIEFEKDFYPRIFPITCHNGCGKSTLIELLFTLCNSEYRFYINKLLKTVTTHDDKISTLLIVDVYDNGKIDTLYFFYSTLSNFKLLDMNDIIITKFGESNILFCNSSRKSPDETLQLLSNINNKLFSIPSFDYLQIEQLESKLNSLIINDLLKTSYNGDNIHLRVIESFLHNKKLKVENDSVKFYYDTTKLELTDLSEGELKLLKIYVFIKYFNMKDSIVLIDNIEDCLHPDYQYKLVSDLIEWESSNQYIIATHSYELCQALTPKHIKEIK